MCRAESYNVAHCKVAKELSLVAEEVMPKLRGGTARRRRIGRKGDGRFQTPDAHGQTG